MLGVMKTFGIVSRLAVNILSQDYHDHSLNTAHQFGSDLFFPPET
jgi:hypothetical protein